MATAVEGIVAIGAGSQIGALSIGTVAGGDIITNNTIIRPVAAPTAVQAPGTSPATPAARLS